MKSDNKIKTHFKCPRCGNNLHQWIELPNGFLDGFLGGAIGGLFGGLIRLFFKKARTPFICEDCRVIYDNEFSDEEQKDISYFRLINNIYGFLVILITCIVGWLIISFIINKFY